MAIGEYALVCFTSPNGVRLLFDAMEAAGRDARALAGATVAAIGPGHGARSWRARGIAPTWCPTRSIAEALVEALGDVPVDGRAVLVARAGEARDVLPDALRERGADVDVRGAVRHRGRAARRGRTRAAALAADYVTFTSSSTVRFFLEAAGGARARRRARGLHRAGDERQRCASSGSRVDVEAERHDIDGLVDALLADVGRGAVIVTLLTDYGRDDEFVGVCHGVIARSCPDARIVDLTHGITRYDVRHGALVLRNTLPYMPVGVHVAVVDPQVGTERRAVALETADGRMLVGPDNGLLSLAWERFGGVRQAVDVDPLAASARARLGDLPRARHVRPGGRPPGRRAPLADAGDPLDPDDARRARAAPAARRGGRRAWSPTRW